MISIMNAGRGAGKTYKLIQWAKEADNRFIVGFNTDTGDLMEVEGLSGKFVHYMDAKEFFEDRSYAEVAFDNFDRVLPMYLIEEYGVNPHQNEVILSSNIPDSDLFPSHGLSTLPEDYAASILRRYNTEEIQ